MSVIIALLLIKFYVCSRIFSNNILKRRYLSKLDKLEDTTKNQQNTDVPNEMRHLKEILVTKDFFILNECYLEMKIAESMLEKGYQKLFNKNILSDLDKVKNSFSELGKIFSTDLELLKYLSLSFCENMFPHLYNLPENHKIKFKDIKFLWQLYQKLEILREHYISGIFNFYDKIEKIFRICTKIDSCKSDRKDGTYYISDEINYKLHFDELNSIMPIFEKNYNYDNSVDLPYLRRLHRVNKKIFKLYNKPDFENYFYLKLCFKKFICSIHNLLLSIYNHEEFIIQNRRFEQDFFAKKHQYFYESLNNSKTEKISCALLLDLLGLIRSENISFKIDKINKQNDFLQSKISNATRSYTKLIPDEETDELICYLEQISVFYYQLNTEFEEADAKKKKK